jgi:hypothetical protein
MVINLKVTYVFSIGRNVHSSWVLCVHGDVIVLVDQALNFFNGCKEVR